MVFSVWGLVLEYFSIFCLLARVAHQIIEAAGLQHAVEDDDTFAPIQKCSHDLRADEARGTRYQNRHTVILSIQIVL